MPSRSGTRSSPSAVSSISGRRSARRLPSAATVRSGSSGSSPGPGCRRMCSWKPAPAPTRARSICRSPVSMLPDALAVFDFAEPELRERQPGDDQRPFASALPAQLALHRHRRAEARRARDDATRSGERPPNFDQRVQLAYWLVFSRAPSEAERQAASDFFAKFPSTPRRAMSAPSRQSRTRDRRMDFLLPRALRERRVPLPQVTASLTTRFPAT